MESPPEHLSFRSKKRTKKTRITGAHKDKATGGILQQRALTIKYPAVLCADDGSSFAVVIPDIEGYFCAGDDIKKTLTNVKEAIEGHLEIPAGNRIRISEQPGDSEQPECFGRSIPELAMTEFTQKPLRFYPSNGKNIRADFSLVTVPGMNGLR